MTLNRLERGADLATPGGREQLQESLDVMANTIRSLRLELDKVREQDRIVAPVPVEAFPVAVAPVDQAVAAPVGHVMAFPSNSIPSGWEECNGGALNGNLETYFPLWNVIGTTFGGTGQSSFNKPNLRGRTIIGAGTGSGLSARTLGQLLGAETHQLTVAELAEHGHTSNAHAHTMSNHHHDMGHTHTVSHNHQISCVTGPSGANSGVYSGTGTGTKSEITNSTTPTTSQPSTSITAGPSTHDTSAEAPSTNNTGSNSAHNNMQPSAVLVWCIRVLPGSGNDQVWGVQFGPVASTVSLGTQTTTGSISYGSNYEVIEDRVEPVVSAQLGGTNDGSSTHVRTLQATARIPYNFRRFKTDGVRIRVHYSHAGANSAATGSIVLRARDPLSTSGFLAATDTRNLTADGSGTFNSGWLDLQLSSEKLGRDWRAGYMLVFQVVFTFPALRSSAMIKLGRMQIMW